MKRIESRKMDVDKLIKFERLDNLFVGYTEESLSDLSNFISDDNDCQPIVVDKSFRVVDGYNRMEAALKSGVKEVQIDVYEYENDDEMVEHAIILNAKRRHLDTVSLARYIRQLSELMRPAMEANLKAVLSGRSKKSKLKIDDNIDSTSDQSNQNSTLESSTTPKQRGESLISKASKDFGMSQATVFQVKSVDDSDDGELKKAMEDKKISVRKAFELSKVENLKERHEQLEEAIQGKIEKRSRKKIDPDVEPKPAKPPRGRNISDLIEAFNKARMGVEKVLEGIEWESGSDDDYLKVKDEIMALNKIIVFSADMIRKRKSTV